MFGTPEKIADYPVYLVTIELSETDPVGFLVANIIDDTTLGSFPAGMLDGASPPPDSSLLTAIQAWAEGYDWSAFSGSTFGSLTVTKYTESNSDATP